jgi:hypothetical protein
MMKPRSALHPTSAGIAFGAEGRRQRDVIKILRRRLVKLSDLEIPVTAACRAALDVATAYCSPALLNHSVRAYLWARGID